MMFNSEKCIEMMKETDSGEKSKPISNGDSSCCDFEDLTTLWDILAKGRKVSGDGKCLGFRNHNSYTWISYSKFIKRAENFGSGLINVGMLSGQITKIGVYAQNSVEWLITQYGCISQSMIVVPLYDTFGPNACSYVIKHAEIQMVVCDTEKRVRNLLNGKDEIPNMRNIVMIQEVTKELKQLAKEKRISLYSFKNVEDMGKATPNETLLPRSSDVSHICYTSGTTGDPKGVVLTHGNIVAGAIGGAQRLAISNFNKDDSMLSFLPLAHVFEQIVEAIVFMFGASVGFFSGDINLLVDDMRVLQPTFFPSVPRLLNKLYDKAQDLFKSKGIQNNCQPQESFQSEIIRKSEKSPTEIALYKAFLDGLGGKLRIVLSGGAPISEAVLEFYRTGLGCEVFEVYGQTECGGPCCINLVSDDSIGTIGTPISGCLVKLVDVPDMGYFSDNKQGEVCMKGPGVFKGYFKDAQATLETIDRDGWLHTGDIGVWISQNRLKIVERKKHIFKLSQGEYLAPEKLENIYLFSRFISQILIHGDSLKNYLVAIVVPDKEAVLQWCKEKLNNESWNEACKSQAIKQLILEDMTRIGTDAGLCKFELVKKIHLHPDVLTHEDGFLTPTMKVKRAALRKHFSKEIDAMYKSKD